MNKLTRSNKSSKLIGLIGVTLLLISGYAQAAPIMSQTFQFVIPSTSPFVPPTMHVTGNFKVTTCSNQPCVVTVEAVSDNDLTSTLTADFEPMNGCHYSVNIPIKIGQTPSKIVLNGPATLNIISPDPSCPTGVSAVENIGSHSGHVVVTVK